jgi:hypothetical protein
MSILDGETPEPFKIGNEPAQPSFEPRDCAVQESPVHRCHPQMTSKICFHALPVSADTLAEHQTGAGTSTRDPD